MDSLRVRDADLHHPLMKTITITIELPDDCKLLSTMEKKAIAAEVARKTEKSIEQPQESTEETVSIGDLCYPFCSRPCANRKSYGIHKARCVQNPNRVLAGRAAAKAEPQPAPGAKTFAGPFSHCCRADVTEGKKHANGTSYCSQCKRPCFPHSHR